MDSLPCPVVLSGFASALHAAHPMPAPDMTAPGLAAALLARSPGTAPAIAMAAGRAVAAASASPPPPRPEDGANHALFPVDATILLRTRAAAQKAADVDAVALLPSSLMLKLGVMRGGWLAISSSSTAAPTTLCSIQGAPGTPTEPLPALKPRYIQAFPAEDQQARGGRASPGGVGATGSGDKTKKRLLQPQAPNCPSIHLARSVFAQLCASHFTVESIARNAAGDCTAQTSPHPHLPSPPPASSQGTSQQLPHGRVAVARLVLSRPPRGCTEQPPAARAVTVSRVLAPRHDRSVAWSVE